MNNLDIVFAIAAALLVLAMLAGLGVVLAIAMAREGAADPGGAGAGPRAGGWTLMRRALGKRCPRCGRGRVFASYFRMNPRCAECGAVFWVDQGEWLGPFVLDYSCATAAAVVVWAAMELAAPEISETAELAVLAVVIMASLFASFPWSRSLWTLFLYVSGAMGERPVSAEAAAATPPRGAPPPD